MTFFKDTLSLIKKYYIPIGLFFTILFLLVSFIAPYIFTQPAFTDNLDFTARGAIGDTIGGLMNPFIAISASILTFMAFYIQYKANQEVQKQFRIQQFESQFYEMLRLHKENVNEVSVSETKTVIQSFKNNQIAIIDINGRKAFEHHVRELEINYNAAKIVFEDMDKDFWLKKAYHLYFFGLGDDDKKNFYVSSNKRPPKSKTKDREFYDKIKKTKGSLQFEKIEGHATYLAHLYRHLFQMVKFVATQDESFISYEEQRKYLRILRAQLSNPEQVMLFYNWKSNFGFKWEEADEESKDNSKKNKFFTDYRMIHNLYQDIIFEDFKLEEIFDLNGYFRKEKDRDKDPLFEYEDWKDD
ncbi:putative phage abortive infection protein [Flavobacterium sp. LS2P90]|uniref:Phage abortive infection protein n=1 Tax=Flavobacterium xylosi TaxID=3230415 RepID=A0ABW6HR62_9FLAO